MNNFLHIVLRTTTTFVTYHCWYAYHSLKNGALSYFLKTFSQPFYIASCSTRSHEKISAAISKNPQPYINIRRCIKISAAIENIRISGPEATKMVQKILDQKSVTVLKKNPIFIHCSLSLAKSDNTRLVSLYNAYLNILTQTHLLITLNRLLPTHECLP